MTTEQIIIEMLTENTGTALCDSGGRPQYDEAGNYVGSQYGYGRSYERNQRRDFAAEPEAVITDVGVYEGHLEISVSVSTFHFLTNALEYDEEMDAKLQAFIKSREDTSWLQDMMDFPETLNESEEEWSQPLKALGLYGEGDPFTVNTYNHESTLDQVLQLCYFTYDGEAYVLLQIHGGCDVRGGYTRPRAFRETALFDDARVTLVCTSREHCWNSDDAGYHWYSRDDYPDLHDLPAAQIECESQIQALTRGTPVAKLGQPTVCLMGETKVYCPICGGQLEALP